MWYKHTPQSECLIQCHMFVINSVSDILQESIR